jgi:hypothetical protein
MSIKLITSDQQELVVTKDLIAEWTTINEMLKDIGEEHQDEPLPVPNVTLDVLKRVVAYSADLNKNPKEVAVDPKMPVELANWEKVHFEGIPYSIVFDIILASNYLNFKTLLDTSCKFVALLIKGKSPDEIRKMFNITAPVPATSTSTSSTTSSTTSTASTPSNSRSTTDSSE